MSDITPNSELKVGDESKKLFIICPIKSEGSETRKRSDQVEKYIIQEVAEKKGYKVDRADRISTPGRIDAQIVERLISDDLVVADITEHNPNVFYELAVRHAVGKPVILIGKSGEIIPFDISAQRIIFYDETDLDSVEIAKEELEKQIESVGSDTFIVDSPIRNSITLRTDSQPESSSNEMKEVLMILRNQTRRIDEINYALSKLATSKMKTKDLEMIQNQETIDLLNELSHHRKELPRSEYLDRMRELERLITIEEEKRSKE